MLRSTARLDHYSGNSTAVISRALQVRRAMVRAAERTSPPRTGMVGLDFSPASVDAARLLYQMVSDEGTLFLVHVVPINEDGWLTIDGADRTFERSVRDAFDELLAQLDAGKRRVRVTEVWRAGGVVSELVDFARSNRVDMIGIGCGSEFNDEEPHVVAAGILGATKLPVLLVPERLRGAAPNDGRAWQESRRAFAHASRPRIERGPARGAESSLRAS